MLNIFLIILMLTGIVVFSSQPTDKTTDNTATSTNKTIVKVAQQTKPTIVTKVATAVKPATIPVLLTQGNVAIRKTA